MSAAACTAHAAVASRITSGMRASSGRSSDRVRADGARTGRVAAREKNHIRFARRGVRCHALGRSPSPSRNAGDKAPIKTIGAEGRGKGVAPKAANSELVAEDEATSTSGDLPSQLWTDEMSAKVAQLQAALAEVDMDAGVSDSEDVKIRKRLEDGYNMETPKPVAPPTSAATATAPRTTKTVLAPGDADAPARRGRPKGSKNKIAKKRGQSAAGTGSAADGKSATISSSATTRAGNVVRKTTKRDPSTSRRQTDSMKTYLKDIGSVSLLTGEQEVELAMRIQDLVYLEGVREQLEEEAKRRKQTSEVSNFDWAIAANVTERELKERLDAGKRAKNQMIQANLRLVVSIAKRYANKSMSFQDLIQEGCVGLIRGAEKFDFKRGYKFSTYAHWWIRQAVTRSISDQSRTIRLPVHLFEIISRMSKVERQLVMKYGRDPTTEEIAEVMDMTVEKINQIQKASLVPISLSQSVNDDDSRTVEETLVDDHAEHPDDATGKVLLKEDLENVLNTLSPRERDVLRLRYGMDDGRVKTLEEIGNVFSVTRERIRQIEAKALRKLRQPSRNGILREYLPNDHDAVKGDVGDSVDVA